MRKFKCTVCGYIVDEPNGVFEDLPSDWVCPICAATKEEFELQNEGLRSKERKIMSKVEISSDMKEMSPLEISALCTNLARGCEKQYKLEQAELFIDLAAYYKKISPLAENSNLNDLTAIIEKNLNEDIPNASAIASEAKDRGALRALVWNEKVTRILKSILSRYKKQGGAMFENTGVYVCTVCGFIYIGDNLPEVCPVCKVPNWKFEKIEGGRADV